MRNDYATAIPSQPSTRLFRTPLDPFIADRYDSAVARTEALLETLRELLAAGNPGLVTRRDFVDLEDRVAELEELLDEIEERLAEAAAPN